MKKFSNIVRNAGHSTFRIVRRFWRNNLALLKRIQLGWRHRDEQEFLKAIVLLMMESGRVVLVIAFFTCIVAAFFKPHCLFMALLYAILNSMWKANIEEIREENHRK